MSSAAWTRAGPVMSRRRARARLLFVLILISLFFFILVIGDTAELERIGAYHLELAATLRAGDRLTFIDLIFFEFNSCVTFRTVDHGWFLRTGMRLYLRSRASIVKCKGEFSK